MLSSLMFLMQLQYVQRIDAVEKTDCNASALMSHVIIVMKMTAVGPFCGDLLSLQKELDSSWCARAGKMPRWK